VQFESGAAAARSDPAPAFGKMATGNSEILLHRSYARRKRLKINAPPFVQNLIFERLY
jgi:hypothetical protein